MPDTNAYLYLGLTVVFAVLGLYVAATFVRFRNTRKELDVLEHLKQES